MLLPACPLVLQMGAGNLSYLFTWQGSQPELDPVLFVAHTDVVPVAQETLKVRCLAASTGTRQTTGQ